MNKNNKLVLGIIALVVIVAGGWYVLSQNATPKLAEGPVKIGVILPLTGDVANLGEPARNVIKIATDEINAAGGIDGNNIELIFEDGACDSKTAASAMQKLANVDGVQVVIGAGCSGESLSAEPIATAAKVAMLSPFSSTPALSGISPYFARNYPSDAFQASVIAGVAAEKELKKVAVIQEQTDYALALAGTFKKEFEAKGGAVVSEAFTTDTTDFKTTLSKLRAENPDALYLVVQSSPSGQKILQQLSDLGWSPQLFLADAVIGDSETVTRFKGILEGAVGAEFAADPGNTKLATLNSVYKAKYGAEPAYQAYMQTSYDSVYLVADAVKAVGYDGTAIANYLRTEVKNYQGASGFVTIGPDGDPTVGHQAEVIRDGKVEPYVQ